MKPTKPNDSTEIFLKIISKRYITDSTISSYATTNNSVCKNKVELDHTEKKKLITNTPKNI